jgi:6-pyruvoyltetrahydropterin/6-carboxytetrahydropterin synthase
VGQKADLYSHFETLNEKAYTKSGKDLGLYLCICKYCQSAYETAMQKWEHAQKQQQQQGKEEEGRRATTVAESQPEPPTPFPRTRRYCVNHQKQCPHVPLDTAMTAIQHSTTTQQHAKLLKSKAETTAAPSTVVAAAASTSTTRPSTAAQVPPLTTAAAAAAAQLPTCESGGSLSINQFVPQSTFEVFVAKDTFKFNAAHFVAFEGFRERLHGHNYTVSVRLQGSHNYIGPDGYVLDFGNIKKVCKEVCKDLNEYFLCPMYSDVLQVTHLTTTSDDTNEGGESSAMIRLDCSVDGAYFLMPRKDVKLLPIVHATAEELAIYLWSCVMERLDGTFLRARGIQFMELTVAEAPGQQASFRYPVQTQTLDVRSFIRSGLPLHPKPCLPVNNNNNSTSKRKSSTRTATTAASPTRKPTLESFLSLTNAMKAHGLLTRDVSSDEMSRIMKVLEK